jgi:hypothetical protein
MLMPHYVGMSLCKYSCCPIVQYVHHAQHPYRNNPAIQLYKMYMSRAGELCLILGITNWPMLHTHYTHVGHVH